MEPAIIAWPMGMPMNDQAKNRMNMIQAATLIGKAL
jgi:hypothetical protein